MKAKLVPLIFEEINEREQTELQLQLQRIRELYGDTAELLQPVPVGAPLRGCGRDPVPADDLCRVSP